MNYDRLEFLDAVDDLAKRVGMEVPRDTHVRNEDSDSRELYAAVDAAATYFQQQLAGSDKARAYIDKRDIDPRIVARYAIGYAPDGYSGLKDALGTDPRRMGLLERAGLFSKNDKGHVYDKFRDRLMFPIHDRRGRVIAFGGRVLGPEDTPKYLNSPETVLFHKGCELYGLWQAKQANPKLDRLIVVEGYMDVVALAQYGVTQAVATLGTATTPDHAELLFRNAPDVYFCFDGDRAGRGAAWKALESVLPRMKDGRQAFFLFLPEGEDPDSIVRKEGAAGFAVRLQQAMPLSEFFYAELGKDVNLGTLDGKARLAERCKPMLAQIPDGAFGDLMRQRLTELTGVGRIVTPDSQPSVQRHNATGLPAKAQKQSLVRSAITALLQQPSVALALAIPLRFSSLDQPGVELLAELILLVHQRPDITIGALLDHFQERSEGAALTKLATARAVEATASTPLDARVLDDADKRQQTFLDAITRLETQALQQRVVALQAKKMDSGLDDVEKGELRDLLTYRGRTA